MKTLEKWYFNIGIRKLPSPSRVTYKSYHSFSVLCHDDIFCVDPCREGKQKRFFESFSAVRNVSSFFVEVRVFSFEIQLSL